MKRISVLALVLVPAWGCGEKQGERKQENTIAVIDREALVKRHNVKVNEVDTLASLSVGNGSFAFTVDVTGLQSFPAAYQNGIALGTQSEWGWNSLENSRGYRFVESLKTYEQYGRKITYASQWSEAGRHRDAADWFRKNPHRLQLGNLGFEIAKQDGSMVTPDDIKDIRQELDLWTGQIKSVFRVDDEVVEVWTVADPGTDLVSFRVKSGLIGQGRLKIRLRFPYPTAGWADTGTNRGSAGRHKTALSSVTGQGATVVHQLDSLSYAVKMNWEEKAQVSEKEPHYFIVAPGEEENSFSMSCLFTTDRSDTGKLPSFPQVASASADGWESFWKSGGAVDFSGSTDPRAGEIERRVVLSQYLTRLQCAGAVPPQETGLTQNSWFGKPHLEMHWWHGVHYPLWGRPELLAKSMDWYKKVSRKARKIAERQGFEGVRWQKMTDIYGNESPSSIGAVLIWQQPHYITFAELLYRSGNGESVLEEYGNLVFATADFMASFAHYDEEKQRYMLGPVLIPAQERFRAEETFNPTYELAYWRWALETAQQWKERLGEERVAKWDDVLDKLSPLPVQDGLYLAAESAPDSYTNPEYITDHPSVFGTFGMLPETDGLDKEIMKNTFGYIWEHWSWEDTWGWDFPMTAMTAARLGLREKAVDALLMDIQTNTYLPNGHNYQDERLRLYLPGNGGVLTAVAMMCAGWDGSRGKNPGFPENGNWKIKWEGLQKMP
ncbi:glycoside hydrolase family 65 protein [Sinomicrobium soli]|uniref:hypothetical protein n=1 Tax=Sinomicrobium sp. N-1-3-6 TaxID=2219864 RepID=UPI000DCDA9AA|nr:hypothetical protein [Sinomicrobium sp. N-1-3-6]RAV28177.1 hypothetical protein DN748_14940 [Sinomicrobium sp. N-1-3-6]